MQCQINHLFSESICMSLCRDDSENITLKSGACICIIYVILIKPRRRQNHEH